MSDENVTIGENVTTNNAALPLDAKVTIVVVVDGVETVRQTTLVERWAVDYVTQATLVQSEDPDYEAARVALANGGRKR